MTALPARAVEGQPYVRGIDGLRAVAVSAVVVYHLAPWLVPGGFLGVDVFFVISGYVVTGSLRRDANLALPAFLAAFYARRFRRILPALLVCLLATVVASIAFIPKAWLSESIQATGLAAFFGVGNFVLAKSGDGYFAPRAEFNPFTHTWSLGVEEQFYLVFPLLLAISILHPSEARSRAGRVVLGAALTASLAWCAWATAHQPEQAFYLLPARYWELAVGAATCLAGPVTRARLVAALGARTISFAAAAALLASLALASRAGVPFPWALPAVFATAALIAVLDVAPRAPAPARWLASFPMVTLGLLSYSLYLWHWPVYTVFRWTVGLDGGLEAVCAVALSVVLATTSYRLVEVPFQRGARVRSLPNGVIVTTGLLAAVVGAWAADQAQVSKWRFALGTVAKHERDWYPQIAPLDTTGPPSASDARCRVTSAFVEDDGVWRKTFAPTDCAVKPSNPPLRLFVAGDSHAMAAERLLQLVASAEATPVTVLARGSCPIASLMQPDALATEACRAFRARAIEEILADARPGDVVWLDSLRMPRLSEQGGSTARAAAPDVADDSASRRVAADEAEALVDKLRRAGLWIVINAPLPVLPAPAFRCSDWFNRSNPGCRAGLSVAWERLEGQRRVALDTLERIAAPRPEVRVWDPFPILCPSDPCTAIRDGRPVFFDGDHLSGHGNELLLPSFLAMLETLRPRRDAASAAKPRP